MNKNSTLRLVEKAESAPRSAADELRARQCAIMDTKQLLLYIKPISQRMYWSVLSKDPRFPKPLVGGNGAKALHSVAAVDRYLAQAANTGFMLPDGSIYRGTP